MFTEPIIDGLLHKHLLDVLFLKIQCRQLLECQHVNKYWKPCQVCTTIKPHATKASFKKYLLLCYSYFSKPLLQWYDNKKSCSQSVAKCYVPTTTLLPWLKYVSTTLVLLQNLYPFQWYYHSHHVNTTTYSSVSLFNHHSLTTISSMICIMQLIH